MVDMTHKKWVSEIRRCVDVADKAPDKAVVRLRRLVTRMELRRGVGTREWHVSQTLAVIGAVLSGDGRHAAAGAAFGRLAKLHELELVYHQHALVSALASEAIELVSIGEMARATKVVRRAEERARSLRGRNGLLKYARKALAAYSKKVKPRRSAAANRRLHLPAAAGLQPSRDRSDTE
jgi:hypothetical protein